MVDNQAGEGGTMDKEAADRFGEMLVRGLRSHALGLFDDLAAGRQRASCWKPHQEVLASLTEEQLWQVRDILVECIDCGLDQLLQAIRQSGVSIVVNGQEVGTSDVDLVGMMFYEGGWISRFGGQPAFGQEEGT
jgi:hypothetical protein